MNAPSVQSSAAPARSPLSQADIQRLVKSENADDRAVATHKICRVMERAELTEGDRAAAQEIIRMMAHDAAELVRRALAVTLRTSDLVPHDVAMTLAQDVASVAVPLLSHSPLFTDKDLSDIIRSGGATRQIAIAKRETLSETVTAALADNAVEEAVVIACANDNARFSENSMGKVVDRFGESEVLHSVLINRATLPVAISERLVHMVSAAMREHLVTRHAIKPETAVELVNAAQERATLDMADASGVSRDPSELVKHLSANGRLTPSLMLRALARGHMPFFEHALAELSGVSHDRTWLMVHDAGSLGLRAIYDRAGMPARLFQTFRIAVDTWRTLHAEAGHLDAISFQERLIERFLTQVPFAPREDLIYLYERLDRDSKGRKWSTQTAEQASGPEAALGRAA
ncbi:MULTISPECIES: DUF2336 domain-containing protein [Asticcacaulis]|uniref:DUF2336 domain-containing protein n=1 Tax=Asticcacaulis TaxID=76890 RepID=UPI001AE6C346|nr:MULTISPECIES: DUF2336 domain-containing protein [Asticcacaulis]MBP2160690.1 uncharacterized protein (DUF2336 family) [Asticcacaulis solisilvae]MDR6801735.1 uncharacterized protein (DUF2336 family) [Asticcacaulis sp. BE141]